MNKTTAMLSLATVLGLTFTSVAGAEDFTIDKKFAHVDSPDYITETSVSASVGNGDTIIIRTSDAYDGRSDSIQEAERVNIYGVDGNGERTLIGTTDDLDDGVESAQSEKPFVSNGDYNEIFIELDRDDSSPNSVFVNGFTVTKPEIVEVEPEPTPEPETEEEVPFVPEMIETTPDAPIDGVIIDTPEEVTIPAPVIEEAPMTTLPHTGTSETLAMGGIGIILALFGWGMVELSKND